MSVRKSLQAADITKIVDITIAQLNAATVWYIGIQSPSYQDLHHRDTSTIKSEDVYCVSLFLNDFPENLKHKDIIVEEFLLIKELCEKKDAAYFRLIL